MIMRKYLISLFAAFTIFSGCTPEKSGSGLDIPYDKPDDGGDVATLKDSPYPIGFAISKNHLKSINSCNLLLKEASSLTAENEMKIKNILPSKPKNGGILPAAEDYFWDDADNFVAFGEKNGIRLHGHCLIWYKSESGVPQWLVDAKPTREQAIEFMETYIKAVVGRYKGRITSWDVVNETIPNDKEGSWRSDDFWYKTIGEDYVDLAFKFAHEADPDALLFYNDYGHEYGPTKLGKIIKLVTDLKAAGVPVHGIGLQMHTNCGITDQNIENAIKRSYDTGLLVHISEITVDQRNYDGDMALRQKEVYKKVSETLLSLPDQTKVYGMTTWGLQDTDKEMKPLLFDSNYNTKPAYSGLLDTFRQK